MLAKRPVEATHQPHVRVYSQVHARARLKSGVGKILLTEYQCICIMQTMQPAPADATTRQATTDYIASTHELRLTDLSRIRRESFVSCSRATVYIQLHARGRSD